MSQAPSRRRWFLYAAVALVFAGGVWYFSVRKPAAPTGMAAQWRQRNNQATPVRAEVVRRHDLAVQLRAIGTVQPINIVTVRSRVEGELLSVAFAEGQAVEQGQVLAQIDPEPYRIKLAQMEAQLRQNAAQLRTAKADLERFQQLNGQALISSQQLEAQQALVADREGALAANQAQVDDARRQLAYTKIEAPIAGRLGLRQVDAGNLVRPSDAKGIVVITQTRPIAVAFTVPEMELRQVIDPLRAGEQMPVEAWDRNEQTLLATGVLRTVDNQIDLTTGTLRLKAEFPNADERLFPNQFVNVRLRVRTLSQVVAIPSAAVQFGSRGTYVFLVNEKNEAAVRDIVLGAAEAPWQAVTKGLETGERVVIEGVDRLREGRPVLIVEKDGQNPPPPSANPGGMGKGGPGAKGGKGGGKEGAKK
jgi:multidrug efflux system membrane fusion protein